MSELTDLQAELSNKYAEEWVFDTDYSDDNGWYYPEITGCASTDESIAEDHAKCVRLLELLGRVTRHPKLPLVVRRKV